MNIDEFDEITYMNIKSDFIEKVDSIRNDNIRVFVAEALDDAPLQFWKARSSSTGKNHPPENNIKGGLLVHIIKALTVAEELFRFFNVDLESIDADIVRAAILLHDLYKQGNPWSIVHCKEHGKICADILEQYNLDEYIKGKIQKCIRAHMSRWTYPIEALKESIYPDNLVTIVSLSDYISSRNAISFFPSIPIPIPKGDGNGYY